VAKPKMNTYQVTFKVRVEEDYLPKYLKEDVLESFPEAKAIKVTKDG